MCDRRVLTCTCYLPTGGGLVTLDSTNTHHSRPNQMLWRNSAKSSSPRQATHGPVLKGRQRCGRNAHPLFPWDILQNPNKCIESPVLKSSLYFLAYMRQAEHCHVQVGGLFLCILASGIIDPVTVVDDFYHNSFQAEVASRYL